MTVSEALQLMVSFGILVVAILSSNDKKSKIALDSHTKTILLFNWDLKIEPTPFYGASLLLPGDVAASSGFFSLRIHLKIILFHTLNISRFPLFINMDAFI
ncbi:hypothetical protein BBP22_02765 [Bacillus paralicheniformis]|nr:hypothetical protein BBP22_02765 [Bacillus paralicheniformis]